MALDEGCPRIDFSVLKWNENAIKFYKQINCVNLTELEEWNFFRMDIDGIKRLIGGS